MAECRPTPTYISHFPILNKVLPFEESSLLQKFMDLLSPEGTHLLISMLQFDPGLELDQLQ